MFSWNKGVRIQYVLWIENHLCGVDILMDQSLMLFGDSHFLNCAYKSSPSGRQMGVLADPAF